MIGLGPNSAYIELIFVPGRRGFSLGEEGLAGEPLQLSYFVFTILYDVLCSSERA